MLISVNVPDCATLRQGDVVHSRRRGKCTFLGMTLDKKQWMFKDKNNQFVFVDHSPEDYHKFLDLTRYW